MSDFLAAAVQALDAPEPLVMRSAEARAKASGSSVDDVLQAWAGGGSVAAAAPAAAPEPEAPPAEAPAAVEPTPAPAPPPEPAAAAEAPSPAPAGVAVLVEEVEEEPLVAAPLSRRLAVATRVGAVTGLFSAVLAWVFAAQYLAVQASTGGEADSFAAAVEVMPGRAVIAAMLISIPIGLAVTGLARMIPSWISPSMRLTGSVLPTAALGVLGGILVGALAGALVVGSGTPLEIPEGFTSVPVVGGIIWTALVWLAGGWLLAALTQAIGVPDGVEPDEVDEVGTVRDRLVSAFGIPLVAFIAILVMVLSFAFVFISFPSMAPLTGSILAGSILAFAGLSASKPNMKVGIKELLVAAAGIAAVVVLIMAVLSSRGSEGHGEEAEHGEEEAVAAVLVL